MSSADLTSSLLDISQSLTTNILAEGKDMSDTAGSQMSHGNKSDSSRGVTASRELLNTKRKSRDEDEEISTQEEFIPLIRAPRKKLRALAPSAAANTSSRSSSHDPLLSCIAQGGAAFSIDDTAFHNANKNAKVISKAQRKKNSKGSNYADKQKAKLSSKQRSRKQILKSK